MDSELLTEWGNESDVPEEVPRRFVRAETVLSYRTSRIVLVLDSIVDSMNTQACLRTAESLGVQHVWIIVASGAVKNTAAAVGSVSVRDDRAGTSTAAATGDRELDAKSKSKSSASASAKPKSTASAAEQRTKLNAAAEMTATAAAIAVNGLSNRQKKKISQRAYHAGLAAVAANAVNTAAAAKANPNPHPTPTAAATTAATAPTTASVPASDAATAAAANARAAAAAAMVEQATAAALASNAKREAAEAAKPRSKKSVTKSNDRQHQHQLQQHVTTVAGTGTGSNATAAASALPVPTSAAAAASAATSVAPQALSVARGIVKGASQWLSVRTFASGEECIRALRADGRTIWSTNLSQRSIALDAKCGSIPSRLAVVIGREADGVSQLMLDASDAHIYLPMFGFTESFNVSVACALVLQRVFDLCVPSARGDMSGPERALIRDRWFNRLIDKSPAATHRWSQQNWARPYVEARYTAKTVVPWYKETVGIPLLKPLPVLNDLRPDDALKVPHVAPKLRRKMMAANQRALKGFGDAKLDSKTNGTANNSKSAPPAVPTAAGAKT